jgi:hypothetical protein
MKKKTIFKTGAQQLAKNQSGLALVEFAVSLPFFMALTIGGFETVNYAFTVMKVDQLTINTADGAARIGQGEPLALKQITERDINDVFAGTIREGESILLGGEHEYKDPGTGEVSLRGNARIYLSSVEPVAGFQAADPKYRIRWQRCVGKAGYFPAQYGTPATATSVDYIGPADAKTRGLSDTAVMFVETHYRYRPIILNGFSKMTERDITRTSAMIVRERRDYAGGDQGVYPATGVTASTC